MLVVIGLALSAVAIAQAVATAHFFTGVIGRAPLSSLATALLVIAIALAVRPALSIFRELAIHSIAGRIKAQLRGAILRAEASAGPIAANTGRSGERQSLLVDAVENLEPYFGRYVPHTVVTILTSVSLVVAIAVIDPVVGLVVGAFAVIVPLLPRLWDRVLAGKGEDHWGAYSSLHAEVIDSVRGMPTLKALGATSFRRSQLVDAGETLLAATLAQLRLSLVESGLTGLFLVAGPAVALVTAVVRISGGALEPTELFLVTLLSIEVFRPFRELANHWHAGYAGVAAGNRILAVVGGAPTIQSSAKTASAPVPDAATSAPISARQLEFSYPGASNAALSNVTLDVAAGTTLAIVGASGSGKSTLATLLLGLAQPTSGSLTIAGVETAVLSQEGCSALVSIVSQQPVLFSGSIRHNLLIVAPQASEAELERAIDLAGARDIIDESRGGLDAEVGDNGGLLSGGQKQRLAIARAILRNTPLVILDEASSALDSMREREVFDSMRSLRRPDGSALTLVVIAHRLAAIRPDDFIVVLDAGSVVESGRFDELLARGGAFARLHDAQYEEVPA